MSGSNATLVDTDVFSLLYVLPPTADPRIPAWGGKRMRKATELLYNTPTIHSDEEVVSAYATLTAQCRRTGHALHDRVHTSDRWIAACAIAKRLDLVSGDSIYDGAPNLKLRTHG